jgi:hypothetical protein
MYLGVSLPDYFFHRRKSHQIYKSMYDQSSAEPDETLSENVDHALNYEGVPDKNKLLHCMEILTF